MEEGFGVRVLEVSGVKGTKEGPMEGTLTRIPLYVP